MLKCYERFYSKIFAFLSNRVPLTKLIVFLIYALFILTRLPQNPFNGGRILAEDGTVFLAYAWHASPLQALFRSYAGYLNVTANGTGVLTAFLIKKHIISMADAPVSIGMIAFFFQLLPAVLILWGRADWLPSNKARIAGVAVIALCPKCEEVWLNGMHIQFWLALCCGLILALDMEKNCRMWLLKGSILFLGPLSGPASIIISPFFLLRSWIDRSVSRLLQTIIIGTSGLIQLLFFYSSFSAREHHLSADVIVNVVALRTLGISFLGIFAKYVGQMDILALHNGLFSFFEIFSLFISVLGISYMLGVIFYARWRSPSWLMMMSLSSIIVPFLFGALIEKEQDVFWIKGFERYNFLPVVFIGLCTLSLGLKRSEKRVLSLWECRLIVLYFILMVAPRFYVEFFCDNYNEFLLRNRGILAFIPASILITIFFRLSLFRRGKNFIAFQRTLIILYFISGTVSYLKPLDVTGPVWQREAVIWSHDHKYHPLTWVFKKGADLSDTPLVVCPKRYTPDIIPKLPSYCG